MVCVAFAEDLWATHPELKPTLSLWLRLNLRLTPVMAPKLGPTRVQALAPAIPQALAPVKPQVILHSL